LEPSCPAILEPSCPAILEPSCPAILPGEDPLLPAAAAAAAAAAGRSSSGTPDLYRYLAPTGTSAATCSTFRRLTSYKYFFRNPVHDNRFCFACFVNPSDS